MTDTHFSTTIVVEFVACFETSNQRIWLRNFVTGFRIMKSVERPLKIDCDIKSAVSCSNNNRSLIKFKFVEIKFLVVKSEIWTD